MPAFCVLGVIYYSIHIIQSFKILFSEGFRSIYYRSIADCWTTLSFLCYLCITKKIRISWRVIPQISFGHEIISLSALLHF